MQRSREIASSSAGKAVDAAVSAVGHAAGATVAPGTALTKLRAQVTSPAVLAVAAAVLVAYLIGRHQRRRQLAVE